MSNFSFLHTEQWKHIYKDAVEAEKLALTSPKAATVLSRSAMEMGVNWLFVNDYDLDYPYDRNLSSLIHHREFRDIIKPSMFTELNLIRKQGNNAAHGKSITQEQSISTLKFLFRFLSFIGLYYNEEKITLPAFDLSQVPDGTAEKEAAVTLEKLQRHLDEKLSREKDQQLQIELSAKTIIELKNQLLLAQQKATKTRVEREQDSTTQDIPLLISEEKTRVLFIDVLLKEAGWDNLQEGRELEYQVTGMPQSTNPTGVGKVDYVLWGDNGLPLAVVEAKKTLKEARAGKHQATLYADCIEKKFQRRPLIYYSNGFETYIWDDQFYPERKVQGFHTKDELELMIKRRRDRLDLRNFTVNTKITDRGYQMEAIQCLAENYTTVKNGMLRGKNRDALLVMATGSGKTRTAASVVDMMTKCNWAKRILFLADRNALVTQAKKAFGEYLPDLTSIDLTKEKEDNNTRLVFSTYPTMMNKIDGVKNADERFYGIGHFDLIIVDEAHRSIYQKYKSIFDYFDALLLGLTATPKNDIDHNTYGLFGIEDDDPTFAYELDQAVKDGWLVPPKSISVPIKFQEEGIKYSELSEREKQEYEEMIGDPTTGDAPEEIGGSSINQWLFNADTVDNVLEHLLAEGIKVEGGDKLGKTIIFARNHLHALFIEQQFNQNYPEYGGSFLRVIDNYESKAQDLLDRFTDVSSEQDPQIAVSVDMMDTGIDAPRVVNLVFFKPIRSSAKFWQMIGRGTRLFPDLFGPGEDKEEFLIFDYCGNFEFFEEFPDGTQTRAAKPITQQIFEGRLKVAEQIKLIPEVTEDDIHIRKTYLDKLCSSIGALDHSRYAVRPHLEHVIEFSRRQRWDMLSISDVSDINTSLFHLIPVEKGDDELARRFDMLIIALQLSMLAGSDIEKYSSKVYGIAKSLEKKTTIPQVSAQLPFLKRVQSTVYWENISLKSLETLRSALRELIKYLEKETQAPVYTHFEDDLDFSSMKEYNPLSTYVSLKPYKERVEAYIRKNKHHLVISKLQNNISITPKELEQLEVLLFNEGAAGTNDELEQHYGKQPLGMFIRSVVGLSQEALQKAFAEFLLRGNLSASQMSFIQTIIKYMSKNGTVQKKALYRESPFNSMHSKGVAGIFSSDADQMKIITIIDRITSNASA